MISPRWPSPLSTLFRHAPRPSFPHPPSPVPRRALCTSTPTFGPRPTSFLNSYRLAVGLSLPVLAIGIPNFSASSRSKELRCAGERNYATSDAGTPVSTPAAGGPPTEAESIISLRDLSFGTAAGICVGVFTKKGLKAVAFVLGGVFVLLQYFSSRSFININWSAMTSSYDSFITKRAGPSAQQGGNRIVGLWSWFIDFVTADVQSRATFTAGVLLGLRMG